jgi:hypothetical protein
METFTVNKIDTLSIYIVNLHRKYLPKVAQSKELASAVRRVIIRSLNMLKDFTSTTQEYKYLEGNILKCIDAINENKGITQTDTVVLELSISQLLEVYNCFQCAVDKENQFFHQNDSEQLNLVRFFVWFNESIKEKVLEEMCSEISL